MNIYSKVEMGMKQSVKKKPYELGHFMVHFGHFGEMSLPRTKCQTVIRIGSSYLGYNLEILDPIYSILRLTHGQSLLPRPSMLSKDWIWDV